MSDQCGAVDPNGPSNARCVRPSGHDAVREGHSAPLGVHEDSEWEWHHWPADGDSEPEVQPACDRCTQGVMDADNSHLIGACRCACHLADGDSEGGEDG